MNTAQAELCTEWLRRLREDSNYVGTGDNHARTRQVGEMLRDAATVRALGLVPDLLVEVVQTRHRMHTEAFARQDGTPTTAELTTEAVALGLGSGRPDLVQWAKTLQNTAGQGDNGELDRAEQFFSGVSDRLLSEATWSDRRVRHLIDESRIYGAELHDHGRGVEAEAHKLNLLLDLDGAPERLQTLSPATQAWFYRLLATCPVDDPRLPPERRILAALQASQSAAAAGDDRGRLEALLLAGELELTDGDPAHAVRNLETVYREADWHGQLSDVVAAAVGLSAQYLKAGRQRDAAEPFVQILGRVEPDWLSRSKDKVALAQAYVELAVLHRMAGRHDNYATLLSLAVTQFRGLGEEELARRASAR